MMRMISVRTVHGIRQISADCIGHMAAHSCINAEGLSVDGFSVTHIPSGICFQPVFSTRDAAIAAAGEINALRDDWAAFDPATVTDEFKAELRTIYNRRGAVHLPPRYGDRRSKLGRQEYATDLNGYLANKLPPNSSLPTGSVSRDD